MSRFSEGYIPWNKGKKLPFKERPKAKGRKVWNKGRKTGIVPPTAFKKGYAPHNKGKKSPWLSERNKIDNKNRTGEKHWNWHGGITPEHKKIRQSTEYKLWRKSVFERDNYTCVWCKASNVYIEADHIKPFVLFPELRFAIDNGRTLCKPCHNTIGWRRGKKY